MILINEIAGMHRGWISAFCFYNLNKLAKVTGSALQAGYPGN